MSVLTIRSNRLGSVVLLALDVTSVPLDAEVTEDFTLPAGFGDFWVDFVEAGISAFSGAYLAPAPAYDGIGIAIYSAGAVVDILGDRRFVNVGSQSARPVLNTSMELYRRTIFRQTETITISTAILAGAGVTGTVSLRMRGLRATSG